MQPSDARTLRGAAIPSALAGAVAIVAGLLLGGAKGALGAAIATVVVIAFFSISVVAVSYASKISPQMMFAAAVFSYIFKILGMFVLISVFEDVTAWNNKAFAWAVIALTLVWISAEIRHTLTTKTLYIDEPAAPAAGPKADADRSP
ncbi:hypothetical protein [Actinomadura rudentiformis]|uniref:ATP synthase subunit I n=1 Tax=Actinomadura rudentiformis TaxID=359158 RepID=A0A6H9YUJ7_9ACTN|nr:hypothetical protein [Actinomadura rudentiformis]KAB2345950.1 hypothetical protein F8566_24840 [Actinomadura rudentiformis]